MPEDQIDISEAVGNLALMALEHGMASRRTGATLMPFVLFESGGQHYIHGFATEPYETALAEAKAFLLREADSTAAYSLAYDGTVTVEGTTFDAILVIAGEQGSDAAFVFTQRYDAAASPVSLIGSPAFIGQHASLLNKASS